MKTFTVALIVTVAAGFSTLSNAAEPASTLVPPALGAYEVLPETAQKMREIEQGYERANSVEEVPVNQASVQDAQKADEHYLAASY